MITADGKRLMNNVLANRDTQIGTHIALGINIVSDASIDGSVEPRTHNRYHSPYIVDEIPIANAGLIDGDPDELIFTGQAPSNKYYIANNIALIAVRSSLETNQKVIASAVPLNWTENTVVAPTNVKNFTEDGYFLLNDTNDAVYNTAISLYGSSLNDIIAFPFTVHGGTVVPTNIALTLTFTYHDPNNNSYTSSLTRTVILSGGAYRLNNDPTNNEIPVASFNAQGNPTPFLFQARLNDFTNKNSLVANSERITRVVISAQNAGAYTLACGSIKLTSENVSNFYRITTGFRRLNRVLYKTSTEAYVNAEYKILGVR